MGDLEHLAIVIPKNQWPGELISMNAQRGQTKYLAKKTAPWRELGTWLGRQHRVPEMKTPVRAWVEFTFPDNRRRDTPNYYPTVKALIDGLVDAGIVPDDCDGLMEGPFPKRVYPNGPNQLRVVLVTIPADDLGTPEGVEK